MSRRGSIRTFGLPATIPLLLAGCALLLAGCASHPPPLPSATPDRLPEAWLDPLGEAPCPGPLKARVRLRIEAPGRRAVRLDGTLLASLPDTLRLSARVGVFRPVFNLIAQPDSCELLIHGEKLFWITGRDEIDWQEMNPSTWFQVLSWALCPTSLVAQLRSEETGRMVGRYWEVEGRIVETPLSARIAVDPRTRSIARIEVRSESGEPIVVELGEYGWLGDAWLPGKLSLRVPDPDGVLTLEADLVAPGRMDPKDRPKMGILRPPGWHPVRSAAVLPIPQLVDPSEGNGLPPSP